MIILIAKYWLKQQRAFWRACCRNAALYRRWPTLNLIEPVFWTHDDLDAIELGEDITIGPFSEIYVQKSRVESKIPGTLRIGDHTWIGASANFRAAGGKIVLGRYCLIAQHVALIASNHIIHTDNVYLHSHWDETKTGVILGDNVWLGCGVTVLPGCEIGSNAVIGAGSVVTRSVPAGAIWAGNPARQVSYVK